ncbi:glycine dehydrogenase (decarboxylating) alpha subunit [Isosphaera pallida ATCC 43644]|uniref:Probable glycine dehydrogenase (decarboxylating) subunit 1 n=1 Tax=Isosphaera pallida (strain ATCC 43644 / DSM 9630 / IS1B) TaxID=575540 RepID=E8QZW5_ISOPI|nr:aminomethyl-transferring glycine dehydrogenase subunit GcvPA [Isosphaera pallida]ADV63256.1 glycine dehydrogenase (decarboxylating) alpha subunit [Isosphaera pallida ATCC 43644]
MPFLPQTDDDREVMLKTIGVASADELFDVIPDSVRLRRPLNLPPALGEVELTQLLNELAALNQGVDHRPCFLGGGAYDHFVPAAVDTLASRGEFFTAYTPYQAEASQGTLQAIFEYQTLMAELTGMEISNASLYDGPSAAAEAALMALAVTGREGKIIAVGTVHPEIRQTLETFLINLPARLEVVPFDPSTGRIHPETLEQAIDETTAAVVFQQPNIFGGLEPIADLIAIARAKGALAIVSVDPISLGLLKKPGDYGADIVVGEGQGLGNHLNFGGPLLGILTCREAFVRKMPGRIVGQTTDHHGKRCWVLTLQTREQHIRREKATSNICTNQGLLALRSSIYLALLGPRGLRQVAEVSTRRAHLAAEKLTAIPGLSLAFPDLPFFKEFVLKVDPATGKTARQVLDLVNAQGFHGGLALDRWFPEMTDALMVAVTEKRTSAEIDRLARAYASALA